MSTSDLSASQPLHPDPSVARPRVLVVLCTYNEIGNLAKLFASLDEHIPDADVLVVDDHSPDGSAAWVEQRMSHNARTHLLLRSGKLGLGSALRDAIRWCLERGYDYMINLDADLSHDPASAPKLLDACLQKDVDVAVGSRYVSGGGSPGLAPHRKLISRCLNLYATRLLKLPLTDCSGSFRCYRTRLLNRLNLNELTCSGYGFLEEILVSLKMRGARFTEVPIVFDCRYAGRSKLGLSDALGAIQVIHKLAFRASREAT